MTEQRFTRAVEWMRSKDFGEREKGFDFLREHADSYVEELIDALAREDDPGFRCLLLELIAEARAPQALPTLTRHLGTMDESLRFWAVRGLEMLGTREADQALAQARAEGRIF